MLAIDDALLDAVTARARASARRRHMHNFHRDYAEALQRMLNALEPETYIPPHRHEGAGMVEVFVVLRGRLGVLEFDDAGTVRRAFVLDRNSPTQGIEIPPGAWHTILALAPGTVVYEVKPGPFDPTRAKEHPPWAPPEGDPDAAAYLARLKSAFAPSDSPAPISSA